MRTKNLFLIIFISAMSFSTALAQQANFGIKAGGNYATLTGNEVGETDYLFGFHLGLVAEYQLTPKFALQPELLYSLEGAESSIDMQLDEFFLKSDQELKLGYINLPVMAKFYATDALSLQAGPQIGYLVSAKNKYNISTNFEEDMDMNMSGTEDVLEELKKLSFGLNFGLGYELNQNLFLQARYHLGLSDISDYEDQDEEIEMEFEKIKNQSFQLSLGYKF